MKSKRITIRQLNECIEQYKNPDGPTLLELAESIGVNNSTLGYYMRQNFNYHTWKRLTGARIKRAVVKRHQERADHG